jgi:hypothetical protein
VRHRCERSSLRCERSSLRCERSSLRCERNGASSDITSAHQIFRSDLFSIGCARSLGHCDGRSQPAIDRIEGDRIDSGYRPGVSLR